MRNVTLSADDELIDRARKRAEIENTTLNHLFREWLAEYVAPPRLSPEEIRDAVESVNYFRTGRRITRDERNER